MGNSNADAEKKTDGVSSSWSKDISGKKLLAGLTVGMHLLQLREVGASMVATEGIEVAEMVVTIVLGMEMVINLLVAAAGIGMIIGLLVVVGAAVGQKIMTQKNRLTGAMGVVIHARKKRGTV